MLAPIVCAPLAILAILQYFADRVPDLVPLLVYQSYGCMEFLAAAPEQRILGNTTPNNLVGPGLVVWDFSATYFSSGHLCQLSPDSLCGTGWALTNGGWS